MANVNLKGSTFFIHPVYNVVLHLLFRSDAVPVIAIWQI